MRIAHRSSWLSSHFVKWRLLMALPNVALFCRPSIPVTPSILRRSSNRRFQSAAREYAGQIEPIIGRGVNVVQGDDAVTGVLAGLFQHVRRWLFALQLGFGFRRAECMIGDAGNADGHVRQRPRSVELDQGSGSADRKT